MLDENLIAQLRVVLNNLVHPVELAATLDDSRSAAEMETLLKDIASLSEHVSYLRDDGADMRRPAFAVRRPGQAARVVFAVLPQGREFTSLVLALLQVGGHPVKIAPELAQRIALLKGDFEFETYLSFACHNCPDVVQMLNAMAVLNPRIRAVNIDGSLFRTEAEARGVLGVPMTFLDGRPFDQGYTTLEDFLDKLEASRARTGKRGEIGS